MHHTHSPLSATARRLLLNKLHVGESSPSSVDLSSHFQCILELARARVSRAVNVEPTTARAMDCRGAPAAGRVIKRHVNLNLVTCWISPSVYALLPNCAIMCNWMKYDTQRSSLVPRPLPLRGRGSGDIRAISWANKMAARRNVNALIRLQNYCDVTQL